MSFHKILKGVYDSGRSRTIVLGVKGGWGYYDKYVFFPFVNLAARVVGTCLCEVTVPAAQSCPNESSLYHPSLKALGLGDFRALQTPHYCLLSRAGKWGYPHLFEKA